MAIQYKTTPLKLSAQNALTCRKTIPGEESKNACNGGRVEVIWKYGQLQSGLVKDSLLDIYNANASLPCDTGKPKDTRADSEYWKNIRSRDEDEMMCYVALNGPLHVSMYFEIPSLKNYKTGVWDDPYDECPTDGSFQHAVTIVGYGTEETETGELMDYWICQNRLSDCCLTSSVL